MSVVADLSIPTSQFALGETLSAAPGTSVEFERVVTHSQEWIMPFLWVNGDDLDTFDETVGDDETVAEAKKVDAFELAEFDPVALYRIRWSDDVVEMVNAIFDRKGTLVQAVGSRRQWDLKVRFEAHASLSTLQGHFDAAGVGFAVERVYTPSKPRQPEFNVTPAQRTALVTALDNGYFDIPRGTTVSAISDDLGISTNAASERLRRGAANLIRTAMQVSDPGTGDRDGNANFDRTGTE